MGILKWKNKNKSKAKGSIKGSIMSQNSERMYVVRKPYYNSDSFVIIRDLNSSFMSDILSKIAKLFGGK